MLRTRVLIGRVAIDAPNLREESLAAHHVRVVQVTPGRHCNLAHVGDELVEITVGHRRLRGRAARGLARSAVGLREYARRDSDVEKQGFGNLVLYARLRRFPAEP